MGSIPVAGAKKTDGFAVGLFGTRTAASRRIFAAGEIFVLGVNL